MTLEKKQCNVCDLWKSLDDFETCRDPRVSGEWKRNTCRPCRNRLRKPEKQAYMNLNINKIRIYRKEYRRKNKAKISKQYKTKIQKEPSFKLRKNVNRAILYMLKSTNGVKHASLLTYLPYSLEELKLHLESQFENWMTWKNHGNYDPTTWDDNNPNTWTWNIDHIIPQSKLPYASLTEENFKICWGLNNLRPLSSKINIKEGAKLARRKK